MGANTLGGQKRELNLQDYRVCWESPSGPLEEEEALLTAESSLLPLVCF